MKQTNRARATAGTAGPGREPYAQVLDPQLVGEWSDPRGERLVLRADSTFYIGTVDVPYWLLAGGQELNMNNRSTYTRLPGSDPTSLVGHWRDATQGEELEYRLDGRYLDLLDGDPLVYFGVYLSDAAKLSSWEYRGVWSTSQSQVTLDTIFAVAETVTYSIHGDELTLVAGGSTTTYRRASAPGMPLPIWATKRI